MEWSTIFATALSTGLATALLNQGIGWWRETASQKSTLERDARYLAIRVAVILERFAIDCADAIADQDLFSSSSGHAGRRHATIPKLAEYPSDADWKALRADLLASALTLRNEISLSDSKISFWEEIDRDCIPGECKQQCGKCGYIAWLLAADLRSHYALGDFEPHRTSWDVVKVLRREHDRALKDVKESAADPF